MLAQRSLIRPAQMDTEGAYQFAQLILDGYSGGDTMDGYLMAFELQDGYQGGTTTIKMDAHTGSINQIGTGQVTFNGNVDAKNGLDVSGANLTVATNAQIEGWVVIQGDLTVNGTTTTVDTQQLVIADPITAINASGSEITSNWTGFTARDSDGYNRIGWMFTGSTGGPTDGYWAISPTATAGSDAVPTRALAYIGAGDGYADLSSTATGNSGASKIGVHPAGGITTNNVQAALEELDAEIIAASSQTDSNHYTLNYDASAGVSETACYIAKAGSGTALADGYICLVPNDTTGDRFEIKQYRNGTIEATRFHLGILGSTNDLDAYLQFNAGTGAAAVNANLKLDGTADTLVYTATAHRFVGDVSFNDDVIIGNAAGDTLIVNATITSDLLPTDDTYYLGNTTHRWIDGYFSFFVPTNYSPVGNNNSLEGHLKGIDNALANASVAPPRGVYVVTTGEASSDSIDTTRTPDQGVAVDVSGLTDAQFRDYIYIYWNGQLLYNDASSAAAVGNVQHDVARQTGTLKVILFSGNLKKNGIIQVVDMR